MRHAAGERQHGGRRIGGRGARRQAGRVVQGGPLRPPRRRQVGTSAAIREHGLVWPALRKVCKHGRVRWRVSWYDALGARHQRFFPTKGEAEQHQADAIKEGKERLVPRVDPKISMRDYAARWLPQHAAEQELKPRTVESSMPSSGCTSCRWSSERGRSGTSPSRAFVARW
jgi:hypothetical protein